MIYNSLTDTLRKILWVIGRRLYLWSRNELTNNPATNGEYSLLTKILKIKNNNCEIVMIDIGANIGEWTNQVLLHLKNNHNHNPNTKVVVFEPARYVLEFSNKTFNEFMNKTLGIEIYEEKYLGHSGSKASRKIGRAHV